MEWRGVFSIFHLLVYKKLLQLQQLVIDQECLEYNAVSRNNFSHRTR